MKSVRFERLVASTALALVLALPALPGQAQQVDQKAIEAAVPMPDTTLPPPLTADDIRASESVKADAATPNTPAPIDIITAPKVAEPKLAEPATGESKREAVAPAAEPKAEVVAEPKIEPKAETKPEVVAEPKIEPKAAPQETAAPATAPAQAVATIPAAGDTAVAERLREMLTSRADRFIGRKADRDGAIAYYKANDFKPLWVSDAGANARAKAAVAYLAQVDTVGLDPRLYRTPDFSTAATADALAENELRMTEAVLTYARHAEIGQIHFTRVAGDIFFKLDAPDPAEVLARLARESDTAAALDSYNPPQPEFKALKEKLAEIRAGKTAKADDVKPKPVVVPAGPILRPGMSSERVVAVRKRLNVAGDKENTTYDDAVFDAVKAFQMEAGIGADGMLGPHTLRVMNGTQEAHRAPRDPVDTILVNMERWRWLPRDLGNPHVTVNVPDYSLTLFNNGKVYWHTKIVAGKPSQATPMISAEMKFITVNPTWNVPPSIIENEYLPALQEDPQALERIGLKLEQAPDGTVRIYQPPGAANALGRIRFNFPNKFLVYQHDTPDKHLFTRDKRAFSHGCMRVQNPLTYGEKLLSLVLPKENYTEAKLERMYGNSEININFPKPIAVHLTYQTAFVDQDGKLQFRDDVYGRDARMIAILKGGDLRVADNAIERPRDTSTKPVRMPVGMYSGGGGNSYNGPSFFDMLFGGAREVEPPPRVYRNRDRGFIGSRANNDGRYYWR